MSNTTRMDDGFATLITLANLPSVNLYEKEVTPPGLSGGGKIDTTTMRNSSWRTGAAKQLKTLSPVTAVVAYASDAYEDIMAQVNVNQLITLTFPDSATIAFYGFINEFTPGNNMEGEQPTATLTIEPTLTHVTTGAETDPAYDYTPAT